MAKKVVVIDCGPREGWNTDQMLTEAERGAREAGAEVTRFRLFDLANAYELGKKLGSE